MPDLRELRNARVGRVYEEEDEERWKGIEDLKNWESNLLPQAIPPRRFALHGRFLKRNKKEWKMIKEMKMSKRNSIKVDDVDIHGIVLNTMQSFLTKVI